METNYRKFKFFSLLVALLTMQGCATTNSQPKPSNQPPLMIQNYFHGHLQAHGIVLNRSGELTRSFVIDMHGDWRNQQQGILVESIRYNDGETQSREWHFQFNDAHSFTASAKDAVGLAHGTQYGNAVHMVYTLNVPVDKTTYAINFDDRLYMTQGGKVFNRTTLSKFGLNVGEIIITYDKK